MIVVDASAILEILSRSAIGLEIEESIQGLDLHAPHLIDLEITQTLRRWNLARTITAQDAERALEAFLAFEITRHAHRNMLGRVWALRFNLTVYDAAYLALAELLEAELLTMDGALRKMAGRPRKPINAP